jgi:hypothetical protein
MNRPGTSPPISSSPIDWLAIDPASTIRIDGGMIDDRVDVASVMPTA